MTLIPITENILENKFVNNSELALLVCSQVLNMYERTQPSMPWIGYFLEADSTIVGSCAFKTTPLAGRVEIAYFTFPEFEGRGYATEMARQLIQIAANTDAKIQVYAQTLPSYSASTTILKNLGFKLECTVDHPEDGLVWEWIKS